jgi:thiamine-monophosphate kinase
MQPTAIPPLGVEFQIIRQYFEKNAHYDESVALGIGDDCALIIPTPGTQQAISVDTSIAGRHFPADADPFQVAYRALNVSLSDLAAMGAKARWFTLALSLPSFDEAWLQAFSRGLFQAATNAGVQLIGGDTTKGPMSITIQVQGELPLGKALKRSGAKTGDAIYVSGYLGDAGAGLALYEQRLLKKPGSEVLLKAYLQPEPELIVGEKLLDKANSCMDISDGFLADLSHILRASHVGAEINLNNIPLSPALLAAMDKTPALVLALTAGDDYKLCFTSSLSADEIALENVYCVGRIIAEQQLVLLNPPEDFFINKTGFDHFNENTL